MVGSGRVGPGFRGSLLALSLVLVAGCRPQAVRGLYSAEFDCPESDVSVETIGTHRFRASGCAQSVVYQCIDGGDNCFPMESSAQRSSQATEPPSRPAASGNEAEPIVQASTKRGKAGKARAVVWLDLPIGQRALLKFRAAPTTHPDLVQIKLSRMEVEPEIQDCALELMVNGERVALPEPRFEHRERLSTLTSDLPVDVVRDLGAARQVALRVCDFRWSLAPDQLERVSAFVGRYQEELAWERNPRQASRGGLLAPVDGWPEWKSEVALPKASEDGAALDAPALFTLLAPSVFRVEALLVGGSAQGSAVAVSATELLTNCHVVEGARKVIVKQGKREYVAELARSHPKTDRCVLELPDPILKPVRGVRSFAELKVGEPVFTLGSPNGLELSISDGLLSGLREEDGRRFVQTTAPISPGSSGGGLFDQRGNLVGITTLALVNRQRTTQNLNFAIAAESFWQP